MVYGSDDVEMPDDGLGGEVTQQAQTVYEAASEYAEREYAQDMAGDRGIAYLAFTYGAEWQRTRVTRPVCQACQGTKWINKLAGGNERCPSCVTEK